MSALNSMANDPITVEIFQSGFEDQPNRQHCHLWSYAANMAKMQVFTVEFYYKKTQGSPTVLTEHDRF